MSHRQLIPHLFKEEYRKIVSVLSRYIGIDYLNEIEDIVSDTFLLATESWDKKGIPANPKAWLYSVAKNKTIDFIRREKLLNQKIIPDISNSINETGKTEIDFSEKIIADSQLQMMFAISHPSIPREAQIGLALRVLFGLGIEEITCAFLSNKETINKRLYRAKEKLKEEKITLTMPPSEEINLRLNAVLSMLYSLFNEGHYSLSENQSIRHDLCFEAMHLTKMLQECDKTDTPQTRALLALMCFHTSRLKARFDNLGQIIIYDQQDTSLWDDKLIERGIIYLNMSATGKQATKYHLEAGIAYWHTLKVDNITKWNNILQLYNLLIQIEYSPITALNRTYALSKVFGKEKAIEEAKKINLSSNYYYSILLGELYKDIDNQEALSYLHCALKQAKNDRDRILINSKIQEINF